MYYIYILLYSIYGDACIQVCTYLYNVTHKCACELQFPHMANAKVNMCKHDLVNNMQQLVAKANLRLTWVV
jgi:hypothetical protein